MKVRQTLKHKISRSEYIYVWGNRSKVELFSILRFTSKMQILLGSILLIFVSACKPAAVDLSAVDEFSKTQQVNWNRTLTDVIVADIFTPPVCSRIYAYSNIAAYEVIAASSQDYPSFAGTLTDLRGIPQPDTTKPHYWPLASMIAFSTTAKPLVYSLEKIEEAETKYLEEIKAFNLSEDMLKNSIDYGRKVGEHIIAWAAKDGYLERTAKPQYVLSDEPGKWKPTPPDYMPAIEPHWNTLRPFILEDAGQFSPDTPTDYSVEKESDFFVGAMEVYDAVTNLDEERTAIAKFWDCNPNISHTKGHLMFYDQKISPGGHWISIAGLAIEKANVGREEGAKIQALTSITLADAFISCWDEKYRSSLIRPETYINKYIDEEWKPLLQTPAFPEHTSGHSVISSAAAVMLTQLLGDDFAFEDTTEMQYGLPSRNFKSFYDAANEAAISRLYGGIHYMPAIEFGVDQGKAVGTYVVEKLKAFQ